MVLLVIDTQTQIMIPQLYEFDKLVSNIKLLIKTARENSVEVIFIRHDNQTGKVLRAGTPGYEIYDGFRPLNEEKVYDKIVNSSFRDTGLSDYLKSKGENDIIVTGLQTDYCVDATIKSGFERGFKMIVPEYCNSTFNNKFMSSEQTYRYYNEFIWNNRYAECVTMDKAISMLENKQ